MRYKFQAKEGVAMPAIFEFQQVVLKDFFEFTHIFSCEPQRKHFTEHLKGHMIAPNKKGTRIKSEFAQTNEAFVKNLKA